MAFGAIGRGAPSTWHQFIARYSEFAKAACAAALRLSKWRFFRRADRRLAHPCRVIEPLPSTAGVVSIRAQLGQALINFTEECA